MDLTKYSFYSFYCIVDRPVYWLLWAMNSDTEDSLDENMAISDLIVYGSCGPMIGNIS